MLIQKPRWTSVKCVFSYRSHVFHVHSIYQYQKCSCGTSFAVQIVHEKLIAEAKQAVKLSSGLHASVKKKAAQQVEWSNIGAATVSKVAQIIKKHQPLTWHYMMSIAQPETQGRCETAQQHPVSVVWEATLTPLGSISDRSTQVITHAISVLNFTCNNEAQLLPLICGLLYFGFLCLLIYLPTAVILAKCPPIAPSHVP